MVQIFECKRDQVFVENYQQKLLRAREKLARYEITNQIFDNFKDFETYSSGNSRNAIFNIISPRLEYGIWTENESSNAYLETLEKGMHVFSSKISKLEFNNLKRRLSAKDLFKSISALTEILTTYEIGQTLGFEKVDFQYTLASGKKPDIRFNLNGQYICLELTVLSPRQSEIRIFDILTDLAQYILQKCSGDNYLISVYFDTSNLKSDKENNIDAELSRNFLFEAFDRLHLDKLAGWNGTIEFSNLDLEPEKYLYDIINSNQTSFSQVHSNLVNSIRNNDQFRNWTQTVLTADYSNAPFDWISFSTNTTKDNNACVEIQTRDFNTSDPSQQDNELYNTSKKVKSAFVSQIIRKLKDKVHGLQFKEGDPVIIAIKGSEWRYDFENDYDDLIPIRDSVIEYLRNFPHISGVILFSSRLYNGKYIENPAASDNVRMSKDILEKSGIIRSFSEPQLSKDKKITLSNFSDDEKVATIERALKLEPTLMLDDDKRELLELIYEFLDMKEIPKQLLSKMEGFIIKYCNYEEELDDGISIRDDRILNNSILLLQPLPFKAIAGSCLLKLLAHLPMPTQSNIDLILKLSQHPNSMIRENISKDLRYLCHVSPDIAYDLATRFLEDNKYVRFYLQSYLSYLSARYPEKGSKLCKKIIDLFGEKEIKDDEAPLLNTTVEIIVYMSLLHEKEYFDSILNSLIDDNKYNYIVKKGLSFTLRNDNLLNEKSADKIIDAYTRLLNSDSQKVRDDAGFFLLYKLTTSAKSYFPKTRTFLQKLSLEKYEEASIFRLQIIDYLEQFCLEFPAEASIYLVNCITANPFLITSPVSFQSVFEIIKRLLNSDIENEKKKELLRILKSMSNNEYVNRHIPGIRDLLNKKTS